MAFIQKFTADYYDWNDGTEATYQKATNFCNSVNRVNTNGWVTATPIQGVHGSTPIYCPSITIGNEYTLRISGRGDAGIYKNDTYVDGLSGSMSGQCHTIVVVYNSNFVHFLIHGCYSNNPTTASMAISCINFNDNHYVSGTRCLGHLGNAFNSINSMQLYDNETYWHFNNEYSEAVGENEIKVGYQTLYNGDDHSRKLDIDPPFITCQTLPLSDAWSHKIVKFNDTEYYAVGTNTLVQISRQ